MINSIQRRFFDPTLDLSKQQDQAKFMEDLSLMLDDLVGAVNTLGYCQSGTTAQRPAPDVVQVGLPYWDTTLGKPIWWNGSVWKDATGATV